jgi:hypothetical protein
MKLTCLDRPLAALRVLDGRLSAGHAHRSIVQEALTLAESLGVEGFAQANQSYPETAQ